MAAKVRIFAVLFLVCIILPSLASAFVDHLPEVVLENESDKKDENIHVNNVAHFTQNKLNEALKERAIAHHYLWKKILDHDLIGQTQPEVDAASVEDAEPVTPEPVPVDPTPNPVTTEPVPVNPTPNPVTTEPVPVNPTPNPVTTEPVPVDPTPNPVTTEPVPVDPTPNPVTTEPVPVDPTPNPVTTEPVPVNPTPNPVTTEPVPVNPIPNPVPVNPTLPGETRPPVAIGYGAAPQTPNPSDPQTSVPVQPAPEQDHPTPKEIKEHRKRAGLEVGFYSDTCPNAEKIIKEGMTRAFANDSSIAAPIPRLLVHDCFVRGCDASLFLDQTPSGARVEKLANSNGPTIRGFELIDEIKAELEAECPGIVSCSDLLVYLARDAFVVSGIPHYDVPGGRRDGMESLEANVLGNLPVPDSTVDTMIDLFKKKGLNEEDLVVLIGAHSIGVAHCFNFLYRLDTPQKAAMVDPRLAGVMKFTCTSPTSTLAFDTTTQYKMDSTYYKQLVAKRGLLESDALLSVDPRTKDYIQKFGEDEKGWFNKLGKAMNKLASLQVLTGDQGQIRKQCRAVN